MLLGTENPILVCPQVPNRHSRYYFDRPGSRNQNWTRIKNEPGITERMEEGNRRKVEPVREWGRAQNCARHQARPEEATRARLRPLVDLVAVGFLVEYCASILQIYALGCYKYRYDGPSYLSELCKYLTDFQCGSGSRATSGPERPHRN